MKLAALIVVSYLFHFAKWQRKHFLIFIKCHSICPQVTGPTRPCCAGLLTAGVNG